MPLPSIDCVNHRFVAKKQYTYLRTHFAARNAILQLCQDTRTTCCYLSAGSFCLLGRKSEVVKSETILFRRQVCPQTAWTYDSDFLFVSSSRRVRCSVTTSTEGVSARPDPVQETLALILQTHTLQ